VDRKEVIREGKNRKHRGRIAILKGNLAPEGAIVKFSATAKEMMVHEGPAAVFNQEEEALKGILENRIRSGDVMIIRYEGPRAYGMPEMFYPSEYLYRDLLLRYIATLFTDGRYSDVTYGPCIGHCSPEAFEGEGIGAIETGDWIYLNFDRGEVNLLDRGRLLKKKEIDYPFIIMREKEILSRPWIKKRIRKIGEKRKDLTPWARGFLDSLLSTEFGVRPRYDGKK
jgi:dihydroxy-acid dehydratase